MTDDIKVEIRGLKEAQDKMEQVARDLHGSPMLDAYRKATLLVQGDAKRLAPVDTGRLRASIAPEVRTEGKHMKGIVGSRVKYAPYMELGTGTPAGNRPHYPPPDALNLWARRHGFKSGYAVAKAIWQRGGLKPRKYLEKAFEKNKQAIMNMIDGVVGSIVRK